MAICVTEINRNFSVISFFSREENLQYNYTGLIRRIFGLVFTGRDVNKYGEF